MNFPPVPDLASPTPSRVLVVDDEASIRRFIANLVVGFGHEAVAVGGVDEALAALARRDYSVALIDLSMPGRSGLELLDELQARGCSTVPILLTGSEDIAAVVRCMKRGAFDYIAKPCERETLFLAVERAVGVEAARRRERQLAAVVSEWAATFDACPDPLLVLDADGLVLQANGAAERVAGVCPGVAQGRRVQELFTGELGATIRRMQSGDGPESAAWQAVEKVHDTALGRHFFLTVTPVRTAAASWVVVATEATALVRSEAERSSLLRRILTAQEDERGRIAQELHDGVGQSLVSLAVGLANVEPLLRHDGPASETVARLQQVATENLGEVRRIAHGLRPSVLDDLGLAAALRRKLDTFSSLHRIRAELVAPGESIGRLPREVESAVFRIVQEALANVAKHAHAATVDVVLEVDGAGVRVMVADDGIGFRSVEPALGVGLGMTGMRERAGLLGGTVRVESTPGRGTTIDARIPVTGA